MRTFRTRLLTILCAIGMFGMGALTYAQDNPAATPPPQTAAPDFDEATIEKFADAYQAVSALQDQYSERIGQAANNEEAQKLQMQAQDEMMKAVKDTGLTVDQYNSVIAAMQSNPDLAEQVMTEVNS